MVEGEDDKDDMLNDGDNEALNNDDNEAFNDYDDDGDRNHNDKEESGKGMMRLIMTIIIMLMMI